MNETSFNNAMEVKDCAEELDFSIDTALQPNNKIIDLESPGNKLSQFQIYQANSGSEHKMRGIIDATPIQKFREDLSSMKDESVRDSMLSTQKLVNNIMDTSLNSLQRRTRGDRKSGYDVGALLDDTAPIEE